MEIVSSTYIHKMFDSVILEAPYGAEYTTVHHIDCGFTFGGSWQRKYSYHNGYVTGAKYYTCPNCQHLPILVIIKFTIPLVMRKYIL